MSREISPSDKVRLYVYFIGYKMSEEIRRRYNEMIYKLECLVAEMRLERDSLPPAEKKEPSKILNEAGAFDRLDNLMTTGEDVEIPKESAGWTNFNPEAKQRIEARKPQKLIFPDDPDLNAPDEVESMINFEYHVGQQMNADKK